MHWMLSFTSLLSRGDGGGGGGKAVTPHKYTCTVLHSFGKQPQFKSMDAFEHPELHEDSAPLVILALAL